MQTQTKYIEFRQKRSFDQVLNATFLFIKHNFKKFFQAFFTIGGPVILLTGVFYGLFFYSLMDRMQSLETSADPFGDLFGVGVFGPLAVLIFGIIIFFGYIMLSGSVYEFMALYKEQGSSENITPTAVWERLKNDFPRLVKSTFLIGAIIIAISLVITGIFGGIIATTGAGTTGLFGLVFFLPFLMFGFVYVFVRMMLVFPLNIFEKIGARAALKRSFKLTSGAFWRTFGIIFIMWTVQTMIGYIILIPQMVLGIGIGLGTSSGEIGNETTLAVIMAVSYGLYFLVSFALSSLTIIAIGLQYFSLIEEKEHSGLMERISEIGESPSNLDSNLETY